jgi:hypothetical protein
MDIVICVSEAAFQQMAWEKGGELTALAAVLPTSWLVSSGDCAAVLVRGFHNWLWTDKILNRFKLSNLE